jgi:PAS domain S-box-containing protein
MSGKSLPNLALISPYPDLSHVVTEQCVGLFNCHVYHGTLEKAASIARGLDVEYYDVILSRGGTADFVEKATSIPVVRIVTSIADLLKSLIPLKNHDRNIAFFNYHHFLPDISLVTTALNISVNEFIFDSENDIGDIFRENAGRYDVVVGGSPVIQYAETYHIDYILVQNGIESVNSALREAIAIVQTTKRIKRGMATLEVILSSIPEGIIVTNENNKIQYFNNAAQKIFNVTESQVVDKPVDTIIENTRVNQVMLSKSPEIREILEVGNTTIITSRVPIIMDNICVGVVCSFTDTPQIQKAERIIRGKLTKKGFTAKYDFDAIITNCKTMQALINLARIYAKNNQPVMIYGESGTGKELFAQSLHNNSPRKHGPFVAINCAAIPESLLESELFGYEGGAFTGAKREGKEGLIELAHRGTLFLDEIGEIPLTIQSRLLRVLQEYEIMRVGGKELIPVDVRIIGATNRPLEKMIEENTFRIDLFYRLNVLPLTIPPLRDRENDIEFLSRYFLSAVNFEDRLPQFLELFSSYQWPGNVREVKFIIERLSLLISEFPEYSLYEILQLTGFNNLQNSNLVRNDVIRVDLMKENLKELIKDIEKQVVLFYLKLYENNQDKVCERLGISKMSLWRKIQNDDDASKAP